MNYIEERPWGSFEILHESEGVKVKRLVVKPTHRLSLQYHHHRDEVWVIKSGVGKMQVGITEFQVNPKDSIKIPQGSTHRITNNGTEDLVIIETQLGDYLGEDDIVRVEDDYNR